jgi:tight adherence protein C
VIAMAVIGALLGSCVYLLIGRLTGPRVSPLVQLGRLDARSTTSDFELTAARPGANVGRPIVRLEARLGRALAGALAHRGIRYSTLRQDLALTGRDLPTVLGQKVVVAVYGLLITLVLATLAQSAYGVRLPAGAPLILSIGGAAVFFFLPDWEARRHAGRRRRDFRRALGVYFDLVALQMAAAAAPAEALPAAARIGAGWPLAVLRDTLSEARNAGRDQWSALTDLGERIGVKELRDLGTVVRLVAHDGAQVRQTLMDRAASIRSSDLADAEGKAGKHKQSMGLAELLIGFGFIVFVTYPAIANINPR